MEENTTVTQETKFCKECGQKIAKKAVICPHCGCQVEEYKVANANPQVVINNSNQNQNNNYNPSVGAVVPMGYYKNKWVAFFLCLFLGYLGAHKFYEGKPFMGIIYLCTGGLFTIGWICNTISLLFKPDPYIVV